MFIFRKPHYIFVLRILLCILTTFLQITSCGNSNGKSVEYNPTGEKFGEGYMKDGKKVGRWVTWHEDGSKLG